MMVVNVIRASGIGKKNKMGTMSLRRHRDGPDIIRFYVNHARGEVYWRALPGLEIIFPDGEKQIIVTSSRLIKAHCGYIQS